VIILESTLEPTVFIILFNLLMVYFLVLAREDTGSPARITGLIITGGLFAGLSIITKPNALLFLPLGIGWLLFFPTGMPTLCKKWVQVVVFCGSALLVVMPVTLRNYVMLNDFVLVTADAGKVFYHGNGRGATALEGIDLPDCGRDNNGVEPDYDHVIFRETAAKLSGKTMTPSESSKFWVKRTLADILADPTEFLKREIKKFIFFFTDYELHYIASAHAEYKATLRFPLIRYGVIASLGALGMLLSMRNFKRLFLLYGGIGVYLFAGMLFLVQSRYRTPAVPYLCLFAGSALYGMKEMITAGRFKSLGMSVLLVSVFFVLSHAAFRSEIIQQDRWQEATKTCYQMRARPLFDGGRYGEAIFHLDQCLTLVPDFVPALNLRGKAYAMLGRYQMAEADFKKLIALDPVSPQGYRNIGFVYLLQKKPDQAAIYLKKALALAPHDKKIQDTLKNVR
jgi:tetratricopeptide (TPR) repeat protein